MRKVSTLLVDPDRLCREGLAKLLEESPYEVASQVGSIDEAIDEVVSGKEPELCLIGYAMGSKEEVAALFKANGVTEADFEKAFSSFGVDSQVRQANARFRGARATGTPELMVAGKYRISSRMAGSQAEMLKIADYLVAKERSAAGAAAASQ